MELGSPVSVGYCSRSTAHWSVRQTLNVGSVAHRRRELDALVIRLAQIKEALIKRLKETDEGKDEAAQLQTAIVMEI